MTFKVFPVNKPEYQSFPFWHTYTSNFLAFSILEKMSFELTQFEEKNKDNIHRVLYSEARTLFNKDAFEKWMSYYMVGQTYSDRHDDLKLIEVYNEFKSEFPKNAFLPFIDPYINRLERYLGLREPVRKGVVFLGDSTFKTLDQVIAKLKGRRLYIDLWATWCGPCIQEFRYEGDIEPVLSQKGVIRVYISIDQQDKSIKWRQLIQFYGLKGIHILASRDLFKDLSVRLVKEKPFTIPRYLIVDSNGVILDDDAPRPSTPNALRTKLREFH
jgi:thiol-disulfide isomerase/thioredoxin